MKLYLLTRIERASYGDAVSFVIAAPSPLAARKMAQDNGGDETSPDRPYWTNKTLTLCKQIAKDSTYKEPKVVCRNYWEG